LKELATRSVANVKPYEVNTTVEHLEESKPSPPVTHQTEKSDNKAGRSNHYLKDALKTVPSLTKELRVDLEQTLEEKLKDFGIKASVCGIPNNRFEDISNAIKSARKWKQKQEPDIQRIREHLERQVSIRVNEKLSSCNRPVSSPQLPSEEKQKFRQLGISSSATPQKPVKRSSTAVRPAEQRTAVSQNTSTPKSVIFFGNGVSRRTPSITTLPFSSEDEVDEDDSLQPDPPPQLLQKQSKTSSSKVSAFQKASDKSDLDEMEEGEAEEAGTPAKTSKGTVIQRLTEKVGKSLSNHGSKNKPAGGINVAQAFVKKEEVKELKFTEADEDDWDISSLEDLLMQNDRGQKAAMVQKNESNGASMVHAWGLPRTSVPKEEGPPEADNTSTLKSSLVTVTDWSDCSDT
ncbi:PREDICTED: zinc finger protein DZIP1-like, partial [Apaloderma vittatum]|uniref:zinc finger protein DZIP1-like n=1 Tax=Apaloderma vittatum TaxID=57397 RepID=UPI000521251F